MADVDIGEELLRAVRRDFRQELGDKDSKLAKILKRIQDGKGTFQDVALFSKECGAALSEAIAKNVTPDRLPNGQLYYNIANTVLRATLKDNYDLVNMVAQAAQEQTDSKLNIHLAPQQAPFPEDRIHKIINGAADQTADSDTIKRRLDSPVRNVTESFYDDFVEENAEFRDEAGLKTYLVRQTNGKCCDWCASLAGRYLYEDAPEEVFAKHDNCTCTVEYITDRYRQNVWSKKKYALTPEERKAILEQTPKPTRFTKEQAENLQIKVLNGLANSAESGIIVSGAISGALNPESKRALEHAERYYESVRHMTNDVNRIAQNTGFSVDLIAQIKDFVFMQKHDLGGKIDYFYPSFEMAQSWQRLIDGKNIQPHDITLLNHEKMERELMQQGYSQDEAHTITSEKYNYSREAEEYYDKINSNKKTR